MDTLDQSQIGRLIGPLQVLNQGLAGLIAKAYPEVHERCLLANGFIADS